MIKMTGLEYLIRENNTSYHGLAKELGVDLNTLMTWVKGQKPIRKSALNYLSAKYEVEEKFIINIFEIEFLKKGTGISTSEDKREKVIMENIGSLIGAMKNGK